MSHCAREKDFNCFHVLLKADLKQPERVSGGKQNQRDVKRLNSGCMQIVRNSNEKLFIKMKKKQIHDETSDRSKAFNGFSIWFHFQ